MMTEKTLFRAILVSLLITLIISILAAFYLENTLPFEIQEYLKRIDEQDNPLSQTVSIILALILIFLVLPISMLGLWFFKLWARKLYILTFILFFFFYPFIGPFIQNSWEALFGDLATMLEGALIVMMYTGTIAEEFNKNKKA